MRKTADVVIIGGGIIGVSIAYHLGIKGIKDVVLLERGMLGEGSTARCAGGIRAQFSTEINIRFSLESLQTWNHFEEIFGMPLDFRRVGYLFLAATEEELAMFRTNAALQRTFGIPVEILTADEIAGQWPFLRTDDLTGGAFSAIDGYAGPYEALSGFVRGARRFGVEFCEGVEAQAIVVDKGRIVGVATSHGDIRCPVVVNAAGPHAEIIGAMAGIDVPVKPYRRQLFFTAPFPHIPDRVPLVIDFHRGWYFRREVKGLLISGPKDDHPSFNLAVNYGAIAEVAENALYRVPVFEKAQISHGLAGSYEISPDNHAILGEAPGLPGFFLANGFSGHGFQHSPAVGKITAELIAGETPSIDISPLSLDRFRTGRLIREPMTAFKE